MIIKMLITFDYNSETNEFTPISKEIVKEEVKKTMVKSQQGETTEPQITLESNKYIFNTAAASLMEIKWEDKVAIKYQKVDNLLFPIIGKEEVFGTSSGNKVTKGFTVSCRGAANDLLSKYGNVFTVTKMRDKEGLYVLVGNTERPEEPQQDEVIVPEVDDFDIPLNTELDDKLAFEITDDIFKD